MAFVIQEGCQNPNTRKQTNRDSEKDQQPPQPEPSSQGQVKYRRTRCRL